MKRYETVAITSADHPDNEIEGLIERYRGLSSRARVLLCGWRDGEGGV